MFRSLAILLMISPVACAATLHVSPGGDDRNDGTAARPFSTLARARDALRQIRPADGATVLIHGGTYCLDTSLDLDSRDSGTPTHLVIWQAAPNEQVRIVGGSILPTEAFKPLTSTDILARLPEAARGKVVQADLPALRDPKLDYPDRFRGAPTTPELFFNDHRMTVARWPNKGWATVAKIIEPGSVPREGDTAARSGKFQFAGDEPLRWNVAGGVWLQGYWCYDWYEESIRIGSIDRQRREITLAAPAQYGVKQGNPAPHRFRAFNVLEELDEPGEFYIDRAAKVLYFWPPAQLSASRVMLSLLRQPLLKMNGVSHVTVRGVIFEAGLGNGIEVVGGQNVRLAGCIVRNMRKLGINVTGGRNHLVDGCDIHDTGAGGLVLEGGDRKTLTPAGHAATNNHIWDFSRHQLTYASAITLGGVGNRAAHNLIHDAPHQAIAIFGNDHVIEMNTIRNVVTETDDAAAIYKDRNPSCRGNVIRYNLFSDIGSPLGHGTGAIYFDDGDGGDTVFGNVFVRCGNPGLSNFGVIFSHGGHDITADNNIFIDCQRALGSAPWDDARWKDAIAGGQDCHWQTKLLEEVDITQPPYTTRYPELVGFMDPRPGAPRINHAKNNLLVRCADASGGNWRYAGDEIWQTIGDPGFVNAAKGNYQLKPDAEVFKKLPGFKPIPFDQIGPRKRPPPADR